MAAVEAIPGSLYDAVSLHDSTLRAISIGDARSYYAMNFESVPRADRCNIPTSYLKNLPYHIHPDNNPRMRGNLVGINQPTYYLSGHRSYSELHIEDGGLDSGNLVFGGEEGAFKSWLCVHPNDYAKVTHLLRRTARALPSDIYLSMGWEDDCISPPSHKNLAVSANFLFSNDIRCEVVRQNPGDLMYVSPHVYHQVVNFRITLAEAVNIGSSAWNAIPPVYTCECNYRGVVDIWKNESLSLRVFDSEPPSYFECPMDACLVRSHSETDLDIHLHSHFSGDNNLKSSTCSLCYAILASPENLAMHNKIHHPSPFKLCRYCGSPHLTTNISRHERSHLAVPFRMVCDLCNQSFRSQGYSSHRATCEKRSLKTTSWPRACDWCGRMLKLRGYSLHRRACKSRPTNLVETMDLYNARAIPENTRN